MAIEYLIVQFQETRDVTIDEIISGETNDKLELRGGLYVISLGKNDDIVPARYPIVLKNTTKDKPMIVTFVKKPGETD